MKRALLISACILLTVGCRQDTKTKQVSGAKKTVTGQGTGADKSKSGGATTTTSGGSTTSTGGTTSTPSDDKSSNQQPSIAVADSLAERLFIAASRLGLELITLEQKDFEAKYGEGSSELVKEFLRIQLPEGKTLLSLMKDKKIQAVLSEDSYCGTGSGESLTICLPKSTADDEVLSKGFQQLALLAKMDAAKAESLKAVVEKAKRLLTPDEKILEVTEGTIRSAWTATNSMLRQLNDHKQLCDINKSSAEKISLTKGSSEAIANLPSFAKPALEKLLKSHLTLDAACKENKEDAIKKAIGAELPFIISDSLTIANKVAHFANPRGKMLLPETSTQLSLGKVYESKEFLEAYNLAKALDVKIAVEDIVCGVAKASLADITKVETKTLSLKSTKKEDTTERAEVATEEDGPAQPMQFQKVDGQRGWSFVMNADKYKITEQTGLSMSQGKTDLPTYSVNLVSGYKTEFQFKAVSLDKQNALKVRCAVKINGNTPDVNYIEPQGK